MDGLLGVVDKAVGKRLSQAAYDHSVRVADTAASLALLYGEDADAARIAGLLHDWDREVGVDALDAAAADRGLAVTDADRAVPYLMHARTGAAAVQDEFPDLSADIADAIAAHTVGSDRMSGLAMVVYIADMIEPGRHYDGADALREAAGNVGLDELFALAYQHSVMHLVRARKWIHPETVAVWNKLVARGPR